MWMFMTGKGWGRQRREKEGGIGKGMEGILNRTLCRKVREGRYRMRGREGI